MRTLLGDRQPREAVEIDPVMGYRIAQPWLGEDVIQAAENVRNRLSEFECGPGWRVQRVSNGNRPDIIRIDKDDSDGVGQKA